MTEGGAGTRMTELRDLYESHDGLVDGAVDRLLPGILDRRRRRRIRMRLLSAAASVAVIAIIAGIALAVSGAQTTVTPGPAQQRPPAGYRLISSLGVQIAVPTDWKINDFPTCPPDHGPTVIRGIGPIAGCGVSAPVQKDYAQIGTGFAFADTFGPLPTPTSTRSITIGGVAAVRSTADVSGHFFGWVVISSRDVGVYVRTRDDAELTTILASIHLVTTDFLGCPLQAPAKRPSAGNRTAFVNPAPRAIVVCFYGSDGADHRMNASDRASGSAALTLAAAINAAPSGTDPSRGGCTAGNAPAPIDALLLVVGVDSTVDRVAVTMSACAGDHLDNGRGYRQIANDLALQILRVTGSGAILPERG